MVLTYRARGWPYKGWYSLIGPGDGHILLPPTSRHVRDVEAEHEGERNERDKLVAVHHHFLEQPANNNSLTSASSHTRAHSKVYMFVYKA